MSRTHHHGRWRPAWINPDAKHPKPWVRRRADGGSRKFKMTTPTWWIRLFMNRPKRHTNKRILAAVKHGQIDCEAAVYPLGNRKPHIYFY